MNQTIRTRFAPSPTGYLHVGGLRTALYNFLFARQSGGRLVLRIEDTDQNRLISGATENLIRTLHKMGIEFDEGPGKPGDYGPYIQSQRLKIYHTHAQQLISSGNAYYCFCSPERLDSVRKEQEARKQQPKYDGRCRALSAAEARKRIDHGEPHVIRLKMPQDGITEFTDLVRGKVSVQNELVDDQILVKSDGFPTYHLANVVDDHLMGISHVIRGEEWLLSVPKHLQLYRAFGWEAPQMAHLPLLLNPDRSKLSKRQGDVAVEDFLEKGYLPEALINFVALLGWNPGTDEEIFSMNELIRQFSIDRVNKSGAVFDIHKLDWMNGQYIRGLSEARRADFLTPFMKAAGYDISDPVRTGLIIAAVYKSLTRGSDIARKAALFFSDTLEIKEKEALEVLAQPGAHAVLSAFLQKLNTVDTLAMEEFMKIMKEVQVDTGLKKQNLWMPIRVSLTGVTHGPELPIVIQVLGKEKIKRFVKQVLNRINNHK